MIRQTTILPDRSLLPFIREYHWIGSKLATCFFCWHKSVWVSR